MINQTRLTIDIPLPSNPWRSGLDDCMQNITEEEADALDTPSPIAKSPCFCYT